MNAYAAMVHPVTRLYFILFYLFTMIVLTIVVASILEAFRFRIQFKRQTTKRDGTFVESGEWATNTARAYFSPLVSLSEEKMLHEEVDLKWEEIMSWIQDFQLLEKLRPEFVVGVSVIDLQIVDNFCRSWKLRCFFFRFQGITTFIGCRPRSREVLQHRMYQSEIETWLREANTKENY